MAAINQLTEKGKRVQSHLKRCDYLIELVSDPEAKNALDELLDAVEKLVADDRPCWESVGDMGDARAPAILWEGLTTRGRPVCVVDRADFDKIRAERDALLALALNVARSVDLGAAGIRQFATDEAIRLIDQAEGKAT